MTITIQDSKGKYIHFDAQAKASIHHEIDGSLRIVTKNWKCLDVNKSMYEEIQNGIKPTQQ